MPNWDSWDPWEFYGSAFCPMTHVVDLRWLGGLAMIHDPPYGPMVLVIINGLGCACQEFRLGKSQVAFYPLGLPQGGPWGRKPKSITKPT